MKPIKINNPENLFRPCKGDFAYFFPTAFFRGKVNLNHGQVRNDIDILCDSAAQRAGNDREQNYTTYFDHELRHATHKLPWFSDFADQMKDTYVHYIREQFGEDTTGLKREDIHFFAWVNRYTADHQHSVHDHAGSLISGTYYLDSSPSAEPIHFINPNHTGVYAHQSPLDLVHFDEEFTGVGSGTSISEMMFKSQEGDFLLWPSYLLHYVPRAKTPEQDYMRYSISFNLSHNKPLQDTEHGSSLDYSFLSGRNE